jgi:deoxycytidylate deaminase
MNAALQPVPTPEPRKKTRHEGDAADAIKQRSSEELVVALSGPVGCGVQYVQDVLTAELQRRGYEVVPIKISDLFQELAPRLNVTPPQINTGSEQYKRIWNLQNIGNALRDIVGKDLGGQVAARFIALDRINRDPKTKNPEEIVPRRVAYVVNQLKNPKEVALLRGIYGNLFYLIGVLCSYERRKSNLTSLKMTSIEAEELIMRDQQETTTDGKPGGQQLEKTLKHADFFIRNTNNTAALEKPVSRFVGLIHGDLGLTPTTYERGMFAAYSASLRSACLSRQVGAAILDRSGNVVSTGCNDVPRAGGGLYEPGPNDQRCAFLNGGMCFNDHNKDELKAEIERILKEGQIPEAKAIDLSSKIRNETKLRDLIEFSRAVHAEMDALIEAARKGSCSVQDGILFTTTYPCHSCARHIVAAGIRAVYFIEPYGKSMAISLHGDAIANEPDEEPNWDNKQEPLRTGFLHFEGVAPSRFATLFYALDDRKDNTGHARKVGAVDSAQRDPQFLDSYRALEAMVTERLEDLLPPPEPEHVPPAVA